MPQSETRVRQDVNKDKASTLVTAAATELNIYSLESIRPIRTAENFEAVEWATGFSNKNGCIVGLIDTAAGRVTSFFTSFC